MSADSKVSTSNGCENRSISEGQQEKINEIRRLLGPLPEKLSIYCSDATISRYLRARNWNVKKATKMLKETLKWRLQYKPEEIRWDDVASEAETGKIYRSTYADKHGRTVLVMRPGCQNSKSVKGQIRFLVYCMENAVINLPQHQEEMVWLIDYKGCNLSHFSLKATRETAHVLQQHYPERLGVAILYNPPKFFEPFYTVVKPFLEPKTANKVKFVYSDDPKTMNIMDNLFDMDQLESVFGGKNNAGFEINKYAERMREDDKKMALFCVAGNASEVPHQNATTLHFLDPTNLELDSHASDEKYEESSSHAHDVEENFSDDNLAVKNSSSSIAIAEVK